MKQNILEITKYMDGIILPNELLESIFKDVIYKINANDYTMGQLIGQSFKHNRHIFYKLVTEVVTVIGAIKVVPKSTEIEFHGLMTVKNNEILFQFKKTLVDMNLEGFEVNLLLEKRISNYLKL